MLQEDSNGESTFEFVDQKSSESAVSDDLSNKSGPVSVMSSTFPDGSTSGAGNLLSNVPPPSELPSFISRPPESISQPSGKPVIAQTSQVPTQLFHETKFSPVIPPSKATEMTPPLPPVEEPAPAGGGIFNWVKGAVGTGSLLSRVAEKAKNSVDSMITTLDPQMREFLHSGGDVDIIVASDKEVKISPVREAFQSIFGKATVTGMPAQASSVAAQPVGFNSALKAAEERITFIRADNKVHEKQPVVAVENFIVEVTEGNWFDLGLILLDDPGRKISLKTFTQMTPVPTAIVDLARDDTPADYPLLSSGFSVTIGSLMASNLNVHHSEWHQALTGVSRREQLLLASKVLAGLYKNSI